MRLCSKNLRLESSSGESRRQRMIQSASWVWLKWLLCCYFCTPLVIKWLLLNVCICICICINSLQMPDNMRAAARSRPASSKEGTAFATGLIIGKEHSHCMILSDTYWLVGYIFFSDGDSHFKSFSSITPLMALCYHTGATEEQTASQMKKEQYRQELLTQIAEQQRNKIKWVFIQ